MIRLAIAIACLPVVAGAQFYKPSAVNAAGVSTKTLTAPRLRLGNSATWITWDPTFTLTVPGLLAIDTLEWWNQASGSAVGDIGRSDGTAASQIAIDYWYGDGTNTHRVSQGATWNGSRGVFKFQPLTAGDTFELQKSTGAPVLSVTDNGVVIGRVNAATDSGTGPVGTPITASIRATSTIDIASIAANICATDSTITVTGAVTGAECFVGSPASLNAGLIQTCYVSAADTVKLRTCNSTAGAIDPASATYAVRVFNP